VTSPLISVVIPTRNRQEPVQRLLRALADDVSAPPFEVIVVDDGSADGTADALRQLVLPYPLTIIEERGNGPASARNAGARAARADILLFLDDDVEPLPGTVAAHAECHRADESVIGIGDLPPVVGDVSFFGIILRGWWEMMLLDMRRPGHRFGMQNLLTGHVSIRRARFDGLGGFDPALRCHEDWEFGYRALVAGLRLQFVPGAIARHHETTDLARAFQRKFDEGMADIQLTQRHPELAVAFPFARPVTSRKARLLVRLTFGAPRAAAWTARQLERLLPAYERVKLRFRWRQTLELLLVHHYWRGVSSVLPDRRAVSALSAAAGEPAAPAIVDLADGVAAAARRVDALRPAALVLRFGDDVIGAIPASPALEPLRGAHLGPLLAGWLRTPYLRALIRRGLVPAELRAAAPPLPEATRDVTRPGPPLVRDEELSAQRAPGLDVQHRPAVPPVHDVA
jgi:glycosyltransferase involved in cell wall biosynthesis